MSSRILITGGCGFIGSNLVRYVLQHDPAYRVINLDALTYCGNPASLGDVVQSSAADRYRFVHGDICDPTLVNELVREVDVIFHLAAESHVDRSIADAKPFVRTNVMGTQVLLEALRHAPDPPSLVMVSTDEVYGSLSLNADEPRFTESSPLAPRSPYAASKAAGDLLALGYHHTYGLPITIVRSGNNFGPYQFPEKIIPLFITRLLADQPVPLYGDGLHVRDWIHVHDFCRAVCHLISDPPAGQVFNLGADNEQSNLTLARHLVQALGKSEELIAFVADRPGHDRRYALDAGKFREKFGWSPRCSAWPEALVATVGWYQAHRAWWRPLLDRSDRAKAAERD